MAIRFVSQCNYFIMQRNCLVLYKGMHTFFYSNTLLFAIEIAKKYLQSFEEKKVLQKKDH
jgi:hypothetical protein